MKCANEIFRGALAVFLGWAVIVAGDQAFAEGDAWSTKTPMPTARKWFGGALLDGKLYLAGGNTEAYFESFSDKLEVYDPANDSWGTRAPMPTARNRVRAVALNGILYVIGGRASVPNNSDGESVSSVEAYHPASDTWEIKAPMPTRREFAASAVVDGKIYAIGGIDNTSWPMPNLSVVEVYDPVSDTWETRSPMPVGAREHQAVVVNGRIYVLSGAFLDRIYAYNPAVDTWSVESEFPADARKLTDSGVAAVNGKIYIFGGHDWQVEGISDKVWKYDPRDSTWTQISTMNVPRTETVSLAVNGTVYIIGGITGSSTHLDPTPLALNQSFRVPEEISPVSIDIHPGSDLNAINPDINGIVPVAILTTDNFDAASVDPLSAAFGPNGAKDVHGKGHVEDADGDGDLDMVLHFKTLETGIQCGYTSASLTGETIDGRAIVGIDSIKTVGCE